VISESSTFLITAFVTFSAFREMVKYNRLHLRSNMLNATVCDEAPDCGATWHAAVSEQA